MAKKSHTGHRPAPQQAKGAARKPQAPAGAASSATLVRPPSLTDSAPVSSASAPATPSASNVVADTPVATPSAAKSAAKSASSSGAARPVAPKPAAAATVRRGAVAERPAATATSPAPKPAAPKAAAPKPAAAAPKPAAPRPQATAISTREQNQRLARARATQRARQANLISAESYSYVLGDLKLIVGLALSALIVRVALTFVLPH